MIITPFKKYWDYRRGYKHGQRTFYTPNHLGVDIATPVGVDGFAPVDGVAEWHKGKEGGYMIYLITPTLHFRFLHLSRRLKQGPVKAGDLIMKTGNTGLSDGPHCHHDIYDLTKGPFNLQKFENFIDPDKFYRMFRLIKGETSPQVFALDGSSVRHLIVNEAQFKEGVVMGMWEDWKTIEIMPDNVLASIEEGSPITFGL